VEETAACCNAEEQDALLGRRELSEDVTGHFRRTRSSPRSTQAMSQPSALLFAPPGRRVSRAAQRHTKERLGHVELLQCLPSAKSPVHNSCITHVNLSHRVRRFSSATPVSVQYQIDRCHPIPDRCNAADCPTCDVIHHDDAQWH
jgi:hypothetical protein